MLIQQSTISVCHMVQCIFKTIYRMSDLLWKRMYVYNSEHKRVGSAIGPEGQWARALEQLYAEEVAQLCLWMKSNISGIRDLCEVISKRQKPLHIQILAFQYNSFWETWKVKKMLQPSPLSPILFIYTSGPFSNKWKACLTAAMCFGPLVVLEHLGTQILSLTTLHTESWRVTAICISAIVGGTKIQKNQ